jgi:hypothetical protein
MALLFLKTSFYYHALNLSLIFLAGLILVYNYKRIKLLNFDKIIIILLMFSISFGIHGLSNLGLEKVYNYNPLNIFTTQ